MELTISRKSLLPLVARASAVADKKSTMPVLANVLFHAQDGVLRVSGTDLYLAASGTAPCDVKRPGAFALPGKDTLERLKVMPDGPVTLSANDSAAVTLKATGSPRRWTLHAIPGAEFPRLPEPEAGASKMQLPASLVRTMIARVVASISPDDTRPNLNSLLVEWEPGRIRMVTTDGHRLSRAEAAGDFADGSMLIPQKAVNEVRRIAKDDMADDAMLVVTVAKPNVFFDFGDSRFSARLVDAQFPSWKQVIPKHKNRVRMGRAALADAIRAVSLAAEEKKGGVRMAIAADVVRITGQSPESGDGFDEVQALLQKGPEMATGFNAKYFLDALSALDGHEEVDVTYGAELEPAVVQPVKQDAVDTLLVVMPMRDM